MPMSCRLSAVPADYGFEYSDDDVQEEDVDIENQYYNSKGNTGALEVEQDPIRTRGAH